jgi:hypothetical protein
VSARSGTYLSRLVERQSAPLMLAPPRVLLRPSTAVALEDLAEVEPIAPTPSVASGPAPPRLPPTSMPAAEPPAIDMAILPRPTANAITAVRPQFSFEPKSHTPQPSVPPPPSVPLPHFRTGPTPMPGPHRAAAPSQAGDLKAEPPPPHVEPQAKPFGPGPDQMNPIQQRQSESSSPKVNPAMPLQLVPTQPAKLPMRPQACQQKERAVGHSVKIGRLEVRITPPPRTPLPSIAQDKPAAPARQGGSSPLARGFRAFGLAQV